MLTGILLTAWWTPLASPVLSGCASWAPIKVMMPVAHNSYYLHLGSARLGPGLVTHTARVQKWQL